MLGIKELIKNASLYKVFLRTRVGKKLLNIHKKNTYIKTLLTEGRERFTVEKPTKGNFKDFIDSVKKYLVNYDEYFLQFEFWNKSEEERKEFCSQVSLMLIYNLYLQPEIEYIFWNKGSFLRTFHSYIRRKWIEARKSSFEEFSNFVNKFDCIVKPQESSSGKGIFKHLSSSKDDLQQFYQYCCTNNCLLEECISNESTLQKYHSESLNTVRIVTVKGNTKISILGAFVRFGTGKNCVDNGGTEGILALIDPLSGKVITDAFDKNGKSYSKHPDSGLYFIGLQIPKWEQLISTCKSAAQVVSGIKVIGWDIVVTDKNTIEIIEGNHRPDAYGLQTPLKKGYKSYLKKLLNE